MSIIPVKMHLSSALSTTLLIMSVICFQSPVFSLKHRDLICDQIRECVCANVLGYGVNLTNLETKPLKLNDTLHNLVFYFNPCAEVHTPCPPGSVFCVIDEKQNITTNLGLKGGAIYSSQGLDDPVFINYVSEGIETVKVQTEVQLECSKENESRLVLNTESEVDSNFDAKYHLRLLSPEACLKPIDTLKDENTTGGMSTGSLIVILLIIMGSAYLFLGAAAKHFIQGATGWEMIPNIVFWRSVPTLFMDGVNFVANGCRPPPSYEQI